MKSDAINYAREQGKADGAEEVHTWIAESDPTRDEIAATITHGHVKWGWIEDAINADAARHALGRRASDDEREAYYRAYAESARACVESILSGKTE